MASFVIHLAIANVYLKKHYIEDKDDFIKGVLIHLITDYEFYTNFLDKDKIDLLDYKTFKKYIYHDYESVNDYIKKKYEVVVPKIISKYDLSNGEEKCYLIDRKKLDEFIINMGLINLDDYINVIINGNNKKR